MTSDDLMRMLIARDKSCIERIEKARLVLEKNLGFDRFVDTYQMLSERVQNQDYLLSVSEANKVLGEENLDYLQVIIQFIILELQS